MKKYMLSIFMLISIGMFGQVTSKSQTDGNWTNSSTWWPSPFIAPPNTSVDQIVILAGNTVVLDQDIDLSAADHPITLIIRGTLQMTVSGGSFWSPEKTELKLPSGSSIIVEDGGTLDGNSSGFIFMNTSNTVITAGGSTIYDHYNGAQGQSAGDITSSSGETKTISEGGSTLPVELLSFDSKSERNSIIVQWQTATEFNSDYFELQRSADGDHWETISKLNAAGNSNILIDYSFVDQNPLIGDNYYRLHQVDFDGKDEYFGPIYQRFANSDITTQFRIFPNPNTGGQLTIKTNSNMQLGDVIEIYDIAGRLQKTIRIGEEVNTLQIDLSELKKGMYIIRYQNQDTQLTERLIIQ